MVAPERADQPVTVLRAGRSACLVFLLIWIVPAGLVVAGAWHRPSAASVPAMLGLVALYGLVLLVWLSRFELRFGGDEVSYRNLLGGRRTMAVDAIASVRRKIGIERYSDRFLPPVRLELLPRPGTAAGRIVINVKVFGRAEIVAFEHYLAARAGKHAA